MRNRPFPKGGAPQIGPSVQASSPPANYNGSTQNTNYVDMQAYPEVMFVLGLGAVDSTVDFKVRAAQDTGGTGEVDVAGKAITQFGGTDDQKLAVVHVKATDLAAGLRYVRGRATVGAGTTNIVSVIVLGMAGTYIKAASNSASVAQVIGG
jgi:hypothetical protein